MKKIIGSILIVIALLSVSSCSRHLGPASPNAPGITPVSTPETYYNNGKLQSQSINIYMGMTITASATYYYDATGKIRRLDETMMGFSAGSVYLHYTASGKILNEVAPAGSSMNDVYYTYDANNHISTRICVDSSSATTTIDAMTFTTDPSGLITRIDESQYGTPTSYRLITRDAGGLITREDIYSPGAVVTYGYTNYVRDSVLKTVTEQCYLMSAHLCDIVISYDSSGFYQSEVITYFPGNSGYPPCTLLNTLQTGSFDPGGENGYYFNDKDLFGVVWMRISVNGFGY